MAYPAVPRSRYNPAEIDALTVPQLNAVSAVAWDIVQVRVCKLVELVRPCGNRLSTTRPTGCQSPLFYR
jgi:hypothetical protein